MLFEVTIEKLRAMKLFGMVEALDEQQRQPELAEMSFEDRVGLLVERQWLWRENRALQTRLQQARLKIQACMEDIDYRTHRGLQRSTMEQLSSCQWIQHRQNVVITGRTGVGKTYVACALAHRACRSGHGASYHYAPRLFRELSTAHADGSLAKMLNKARKTPVLVIDDWGLESGTPNQYRLFLELLDERQGHGSTIMTSQFPLGKWHELIGDATVADAILDRIVHNAFRIDLDCDSMRRPKPKPKEGGA